MNHAREQVPGTILEARDVAYAYRGAGQVLEKVSAQIMPGSFLAILGVNVETIFSSISFIRLPFAFLYSPLERYATSSCSSRSSWAAASESARRDWDISSFCSPSSETSLASR